MSKITAYAALASASVRPDDVLPVVDVHDTSMASSGTTKKVTVGALTGLAPSGDTSGATDSSNISGLISLGGKVPLQAGAWYVSGVTVGTGSVTIQGAGFGTVINVPASDTAFTISNVSELLFSGMAFSLGSSSRGIQVNGAANSRFSDLYFTGSSASGGVSVNGDDNTEQTWTDVTFSAVGGTAFGYTRTTTTDTGGMYLERVRAVNPPTSASHGFSFTSSAGSPTQVFAYFLNCSADSYSNDAWRFSNVSGVQADNAWGTLGGSANSGQCPLHITGGGNIRFLGGYFFQSLTSGKVALLDSSANAWFGGGLIFDGAGSGGYALGLTAAGAAYTGDVFSYASNLSDAPWVIATAPAPRSPATFITQGNGSSAQALAVDDGNNIGSQMWIRNNAGTLQFLNTAFSKTIASLDQSGNLSAPNISILQRTFTV